MCIRDRYLNCGQTCVAPDYVLCHAAVKDAFVAKLKAAIREMYGEAPLENPDYGRIVNEKHFARLLGLLQGQAVAHGGGHRAQTLQIQPTVLARCV